LLYLLVFFSGEPRVRKCLKNRAETSLQIIVVENGAALLERSAPKSDRKEIALEKRLSHQTTRKRRKIKIVSEKEKKLLNKNEGKFY